MQVLFFPRKDIQEDSSQGSLMVRTKAWEVTQSKAVFRKAATIYSRSYIHFWNTNLKFHWLFLVTDRSVGRVRLQCRRPQLDFSVGKIRLRRDRLPIPVFLGFPCDSAGKDSARNAWDLGLIPGLGRSPGEGKGYTLQYSGLENSRELQRVGQDWVTFTVTMINLWLDIS